MKDSSSGLDFTQLEESQRIEGLRFLLNSPAWKEIFNPALQSAAGYAYGLLKLEPDQRKSGESDALLRARIQVLESVMNLGPSLIREYDEARIKREEMEAVEASYAQRAEDGRMAPP